MKLSRSIRIIFGVVGVALMAFLIRSVGPLRLTENIHTLGWGWVAILGLGGLSHVVKTWAWRFTFDRRYATVPFRRLLGVRLAGEGVSQLTVAGQVVGETTRALMLRSAIPLVGGASSVVLDRGMYLVTALLLMMIGALLAPVGLGLSSAVRGYEVFIVVVLVGFLLLVRMAFKRRWRVLSAALQTLGRLSVMKAWAESRRAGVQEVETIIHSFCTGGGRALWFSLGLNLIGHALSVVEVYLILWFLGVNVTLLGAFFIEVLTKLVNLVGAIIPGNVGAYEGGNMIILHALGLSSATGLTLAIARRLRGLFWAGIGLGVLLVHGFRRPQKSKSQRVNESMSQWVISSFPHFPISSFPHFPISSFPHFLISSFPHFLISSFPHFPISSFPHFPISSFARNNQTMSRVNQQQEHIQQAVILTRGLNGRAPSGAPLLRVATMPVVLRSLLTAKRAGATRFLVVLEADTGAEVRRVLERSRRLPAGVEWLALPDGQGSLTAALGEIAERADDQFLLLPGEATFHANLLSQINSPDGDSAMALTVSERPTGIYRFSRFAARAVASQAPPLQSVGELNAWLNQADLVKHQAVDEAYWQPIAQAADLPLAERKLDRWLYKETDGIWARLNRNISIPISRVLIRLRMTPNMVTLFTLLVSFVSGAFFAFGGYVNALIGALLSHWASVLDGSDGEVARLTFQESDFGCWLETMCDYLYYVFVFGGMIVGLYRTSGNMIYPVAGGLLAFGSLMSIITTAYQRRRVAPQQPEKYLATWQKQMDTHPENLFLRFARRHEFIIRRAFLPYAILFFALLNLVDVLFFMMAFGSNLVWTLALYSNRFFRPDPAIEATKSSRES